MNLRLTVNPFGSQASHFPYIAAPAATWGDIAVMALFVLIYINKYLFVL